MSLEKNLSPVAHKPDSQTLSGGYGLCPSLGTVDLHYTFSRVLEGVWEFAKPVHMCFVDLE